MHNFHYYMLIILSSNEGNRDLESPIRDVVAFELTNCLVASVGAFLCNYRMRNAKGKLNI
jgi:hypothetical protein